VVDQGDIVTFCQADCERFPDQRIGGCAGVSDFRNADPEAVGALVANRRIIDGRNCLDPGSWTGAGWQYRGMGRQAAE
jgi:hypothetical protein